MCITVSNTSQLLEILSNSQTEPLTKINETAEESDEVWLEDQVVEPTVTQSFRQAPETDGSSPLERLVQSISSEGEQWADDFLVGNSELVIRSQTKTYHDPTRLTGRDATVNRMKEDHDSDDEINTLPQKRLNEDNENAVAPFTSIVFYRYLFGKGFGGFKKTYETSDVSVDGSEEENHTVGEATRNDDSHRTLAGGTVTADNAANDVESRKTEKAENLPLFLMTKVKNLFTRNSRDSLQETARCPLCGHDLQGISREELVTRMKASDLEEVQWLGQKYARLISPVSKEIYKTELRIEADGSRSLCESYYRGPRPL